MKRLFSMLTSILMLIFACNVLSAQIEAESPAEKPNIVIILADDFGYGSSNCYGASKTLLRTPHINHLAAEGMRFTDANTPGSVCSPTRYALLTGRYAWRGRLKYGVLQPPEGGLLIEETRYTLPAYLKDHGYQTAQIGKWHLGYTNQHNVEDLSAQPLVPGPRSLGFDYHFGVPNNIDWLPKVYIENEGIWGLRSKGKHPYGKSSYKNQRYHGYDAPQRVTTKVTSDLNTKAREWIFQCVRQDPGKPFFLYFAPVAIHNPISPGEELRGSTTCGPYGDYIHDLDHSVGEIIDALAYAGVLDETIVIFTSDNGGDTGQVEEVQAREAGLKNNGHFRGDKHTIWEGGFRVPFIARWPGHIEAGTTSDRMVNLVDVFATIQELVGGEVLPPGQAGPDSFSFYETLTGKDQGKYIRSTMVVNNVQGVVAIRKGPWKYIEGIPAATLSEGAMKRLEEQLSPQLYNLEIDIDESEDLIETHLDIAEDLQRTLDQIRETGAERMQDEND